MDIQQNQEVQGFQNLELLARQVVEGFIIGLHKSPFHGFSVEFAEHRLYNPGETTKNIDWKVFARTDKLFIKRFEEETNLRCQIVIDGSSSMYFPNPKVNPINKVQFAALGAASLMNLLLKQRDAFGLSIFDDEVHTHTRVKTSTSHYRLMLTYLHKLINQQPGQKGTAAANALHQIAESIHKRSMVIIFSDMFEYAEDMDHLFAGLQHLKHNKHEVVLFHVVDKATEIDFEFENRPYQFIDLETGEKVRLQSNEVKDYYVKRMKGLMDQIKMKCLQYKIDFVEADIRQGFVPILQSYLVKRTKMRI